MSKTKLWAFFVVSLVMVGGALFAAGWFGGKDLPDEDQDKLDLINRLLKDNFAADGARGDLEKVNGEMIRTYLSQYASIPHMAGLEDDENLALNLKEQWLELGLDQVDLKGYELLLDYPDPENPNLIKIINGTEELFRCQYKEDKLHEGDDHLKFVDSFLAYSAAGTAEGDVVYVNYGRKEDFELIQSNISLSGKICMVRYGQIFRGNKAQNAEHFGCSAMILFSDPADVAPRGTDPEDVYPNTFWLPPTGMQRGSIILTDGDPETPNAPSIEGVNRKNLSKPEETVLSKIPCQPIGYGDAKKIFLHMDGPDVPADDWRGMIADVNYTIGGSFKPSCANCKMIVETHNKLERKNASNVIGILKGDVEPDRYVLVGNHRDAWGFGAVDPSSGTAQMTEVIRVLGEKMKNEGWRPRRTIIFTSWAAEEYALTGSREFVEDFISKLAHRAVAYLNVDICTGGGDILSASASPTIQHKVIETTKDLPSIRDPTQTYFQFWKNWTQVYENDPTIEEPEVYLPGAGSDHASFIFLAGVPVIDTSFDYDLIEFPEWSGYPAYHTGYETIYLVENIMDPTLKIRETCAKLNLRLIRDFADSIFLDFRPEAYAELMLKTLGSIAFTDTIDVLNEHNISISTLEKSVRGFNTEVKNWRTRLDSLDYRNNPMVARYVNDQMMKLDRVFLLPQGLPDRPIYRHAIISPSMYDSYSAGSFPGITDLVNGIKDITNDELEIRVEKLKQHISDLMVVIHQAADYLKEVSLI